MIASDFRKQAKDYYNIYSYMDYHLADDKDKQEQQAAFSQYDQFFNEHLDPMVNVYICGYLSLHRLPFQFNPDIAIIDEIVDFNC